MLKRIVVVGIVGAFLAAPPAIAKSSSTVKSPAPAVSGVQDSTGHDGLCPFDDASFEF
jgi:hypothetical protein